MLERLFSWFGKIPHKRPSWTPRNDDAYDWSMMRGVRGARGGILTVGPEEDRPRPAGKGWTHCHNCGGQGWDADWGGPFRCRQCEGRGWLLNHDCNICRTIRGEASAPTEVTN